MNKEDGDKCYWKGSKSIEEGNKYYPYCNGKGCDGYNKPSFCDKKLSQSMLEKKLVEELA